MSAAFDPGPDSLASPRRRCPPARPGVPGFPLPTAGACSPRPGSRERATPSPAVGFVPDGWHKARVPNTVVGALVEDGTYADPYFGMNLRKIPGTTYKIGERFTLIPTPDDSPFKPAWWYRTEFDLPAASGRAPAVAPLRRHQLPREHLGERHADRARHRRGRRLPPLRVRRHEGRAGRGAGTRWRSEVFGPEPHDLAIMWVDWNPTPAGQEHGPVGRRVPHATAGPLALRNPHVVSKLDLPSLATARLTVTAEVKNGTDQRRRRRRARAPSRASRSRSPSRWRRGRRRLVRFTPADQRALTLKNPRLWWPYRMGTPELYTLDLEVEADGARLRPAAGPLRRPAR